MATNSVSGTGGNSGMLGSVTDWLLGDQGNVNLSFTQKYGRWESDDNKLKLDPEALVHADLKARHMQNKQWRATYDVNQVTGETSDGVVADPGLASDMQAMLTSARLGNTSVR